MSPERLEELREKAAAIAAAYPAARAILARLEKEARKHGEKRAA